MAPGPANPVVVHLRLIGQLRAWTTAGEDVCPPGHRTRALLAAIALSAPRPVSRAWLTGLLWSGLTNALGRTALRSEVHRLSDALAPAGKGLLLATQASLSLRSGAAWIDAQEIMRATANSPGSLALLDGALLEDLDGVDPAFDLWLKQERDRLQDHARNVAEAQLLAQNEPGAIIPAARRLLFVDPIHEGGWRALMQGYAEQGDRAMAIEAYELCRQVLASRLDALPSAATRRLLARIRGRDKDRPIQRRPERLRGPASPPEPPTGGYTQSNWRRFGVFPLKCFGLTEEEALLGPGLASAITLALSRFLQTTVIAADRIAQFARDNRDEAAMRRTFGIDFLMDGTIRHERDGLRVSLRLLDLHAGSRIVWAERFDRAGNDLKTVRDGIAAEAVARIEPELWAIEALRKTAHPPADATAYDLLLLSIPPMAWMTRDGFMRAGDDLGQAVRLAPEFSAVHGWYAFWHVLFVSQGWAPDPHQALTRGNELAKRAVALNPMAVRALTAAGLVLAQRVPHEAAAFYDRALAVNPNLAMTWALSAVNCLSMGEIGEAERRFDTYKALAPHDRLAFIFDAFFAPIHLIKRDYQAAVATGRTVIHLNPRFSAGYKPYLAALGHLRQRWDAASVLRRLRMIEPDFCITRFLDTAPLGRQADREHFVEGLRLAGVK